MQAQKVYSEIWKRKTHTQDSGITWLGASLGFFLIWQKLAYRATHFLRIKWKCYSSTKRKAWRESAEKYVRYFSIKFP